MGSVLLSVEGFGRGQRSALGLDCSMGTPATTCPPSRARNVSVLNVVAEESARLGPFRVRRFTHVALELDVWMWTRKKPAATYQTKRGIAIVSMEKSKLRLGEL
ncbi:hypothetical protein B296_00029564 [Ensete ventricosum]|uniref:Uncharacterized protein n=1 Tax=Ensete ventricosum TaxID=4639 RepID=A0A427AKU7_ENSVE|nr:hypothetical protein B296_00029564 [Ensete ventricosum]